MTEMRFWWLRAETGVHVGAGTTASLVDLPVAREATTSYPYIPGSGLKGALLDFWRELGRADTSEQEAIFGKKDNAGEKDHAGEVLISDARLAFLPLRSLRHVFVWVTCPYLIARLARDMGFAGLGAAPITGDRVGDLADNKAIYLGAKDLVIDDQLLSKRASDAETATEDSLLGALAALVPAAVGLDKKHLVVVSNEMFGFFARRRIPIRMRNSLEPETKTVKDGALWSEEYLAPETLLYAILQPRKRDATSLAALEKALSERKFVQVGGNETVGEGWLSFHRGLAPKQGEPSK